MGEQAPPKTPLKPITFRPDGTTIRPEAPNNRVTQMAPTDGQTDGIVGAASSLNVSNWLICLIALLANMIRIADIGRF